MALLKRKLRAVIDNNLFISGLFAKDSLSAQLQNLWANQEFELVTSLQIVKEVSRVLSYPRIKERFKPKEDNVRRFFRLIFRKAIISKDTYHTDKIVDDPTDNKFLACALEKKADYIASRDPHLRSLKHFHGIQTVDATTFIEKVKNQIN
jgi:putative PIN family toxin of toxin-antitoxin system